MEPDLPDAAWARAVRHVASRSTGEAVDPSLSITLHFHPDRLVGNTPILRQMRNDGRYRSQFETGTSNGGLTAHPGGERWRWESRLFGGAYDGEAPAARPVYGSLNYRDSSTGGSPRFGSAHFRLSPVVLERTTLCFPDSVFDPIDLGTPARGSSVIELARNSALDALDDYVEAHVHGGVYFERDVEAVVLDPCYQGTAIEEMAHGLPCQVEWHEGYRLSVEELSRHADYRGAEIVDSGRRLAVDGVIRPNDIGKAARTNTHDPQVLKKVWHCLARFGAKRSMER